MLTHVDVSWNWKKPLTVMCPFGGRHGSSICSTPCNLILLKWIIQAGRADHLPHNPSPRKSKLIGHVTNQDVFLATSLGIVLKAQTISTCKLSSESRHHEANEWEFWKPGPFQNPSKTREALSWTRKDPTIGQQNKKLKKHTGLRAREASHVFLWGENKTNKTRRCIWGLFFKL